MVLFKEGFMVKNTSRQSYTILAGMLILFPLGSYASAEKIRPEEILFAIVHNKNVSQQTHELEFLMIKYLAQQGVDFNTKNWSDSAFLTAVRNNKHKHTALMLTFGADPNETRAGTCAALEALNAIYALSCNRWCIDWDYTPIVQALCESPKINLVPHKDALEKRMQALEDKNQEKSVKSIAAVAIVREKLAEQLQNKRKNKNDKDDEKAQTERK